MHLAWDFTAGEIGVSGDCGGKVCGHIDFRHNHDKSLGSIGHDFTDLLLRVKAGCVGLSLQPFAFPAVQLCILAFRADLREQRIFFDFNAPTRIVRQMPVKKVELVHSHKIKIALHIVHAPKVAAGIQHHAAPTEARRIFDFDTGHGERFRVFGDV